MWSIHIMKYYIAIKNQTTLTCNHIKRSHKQEID